MKHRFVHAFGLGIVAAAMIAVIKHYAVRRFMPHGMYKFIAFVLQAHSAQQRQMNISNSSALDDNSIDSISSS